MSSHRRYYNRFAKATGAEHTDPVHIVRDQKHEKKKLRKGRRIKARQAHAEKQKQDREGSEALAAATLNRGERTTTRGQHPRLGSEPVTSRRRLS